MHLKTHGMEMLFKFLFQQIVVSHGTLSVRCQVVQLQHMAHLVVQETLIHLQLEGTTNYYPSNNTSSLQHWRTDSVDLSSYNGNPDVMML